VTVPEYEYYGLMVRYWDLLRGDTSDWPDRSFYLELIKKHGQPVLDIGCAAGRLLIDYLSQGIDIDGVDLSPEMISLCKQNAESKRLKPNLYVQDITELNLPRKYNTILVPSCTIQLIVETNALLRGLKKSHDHLETGGIFAAPFMGLWRKGRPLEYEFSVEATRPEDGATVRHKGWLRFNPETKLQDTRDLWEIIKDGQVIESETHERVSATRSYSQQEAYSLFEQTGFKEISVLRNSDYKPATPEETSFTLLGVKQ